MGKREELEIEAIRLYAEGVEIPILSRRIGVSENSLRAWKKRAGTEWDDARRVARADRIVAIEDVGSRLRRSREIAAQLVGSARDQSAVGMVLNQTVQTMLYDLMDKIDTANVDPENYGSLSKLIANLTLALGRTEQAASINQKREQEIRKQALAEAADKVEQVAKQEGVTAETIQRIRRDVLLMAC